MDKYGVIGFDIPQVKKSIGVNFLELVVIDEIVKSGISFQIDTLHPGKIDRTAGLEDDPLPGHQNPRLSDRKLRIVFPDKTGSLGDEKELLEGCLTKNVLRAGFMRVGYAKQRRA